KQYRTVEELRLSATTADMDRFLASETNSDGPVCGANRGANSPGKEVHAGHRRHYSARAARLARLRRNDDREGNKDAFDACLRGACGQVRPPAAQGMGSPDHARPA